VEVRVIFQVLEKKLFENELGIFEKKMFALIYPIFVDMFNHSKFGHTFKGGAKTE
jgi:hypothetical protein